MKLAGELAQVQFAITYYVEAKWRDKAKSERVSDAWEKICEFVAKPANGEATP